MCAASAQVVGDVFTSIGLPYFRASRMRRQERGGRPACKCGRPQPMLLTLPRLQWAGRAARRGEEVCMRRGLLALLVLWPATAGIALADPVTLTSGTLAVGGFHASDAGFGSFDLSGSG